MAERGTIKVKIGEGDISTSFFPPLPENETFEAISSVLPFKEIMHAEGSKAVRSVVYDQGKPGTLEHSLSEMQTELEANTGYRFAAGVEQLIAAASQ